MTKVLRILAAALVVQLALMMPAMGGSSAKHAMGSAKEACARGAGDEQAHMAPHAHGDGHAHASAGPHGDGHHGRNDVSRDHPSPAHHDHGEHCPACALAKAMALHEASALSAVDASHRLVQGALRHDRASPRQTAGPPVGLRAPPFTV